MRISPVCLPIQEYPEDEYVFMATSNGTVKKVALTNFARQRSVGLRRLNLDEGDTLVKTAITNGEKDVLLYSSSGRAARFNESAVRAMGRTARGVRGIRLEEGHHMVDMIIPEDGGQILAVSENGYGKRTPWKTFLAQRARRQGRYRYENWRAQWRNRWRRASVRRR